MISRLQADPEIATWVESGRILHERHKSSSCEFCTQLIPTDRWKELEAHFSKDDQDLKADIERALQNFDTLKRALNLTLPASHQLYSDLRDPLSAALGEFNVALDGVQKQIADVELKLRQKLAHREATLPCNPSVFVSTLISAFSAVLSIIQQHNNRTEQFEDVRKDAVAKIEAHYLTEIMPEITRINSEISQQNDIIKESADGDPSKNLQSYDTLKEIIATQKATISSAHKAGSLLTDTLRTFLGRGELEFESTDEGYRVVRSGRPAKHLSEGERTAIAFIYFVVQLSEREFDVANGIVVVDDPVSSLDAGSVYQAFAFLKEAVKNAKQVFFFTHSFHFLRLVLNWLQHFPQAKGERQYFMTVCQTDSNKRFAKIVPLDQTLISFPTEYHFLFKLLTGFKSDGTIAGCYHIPNIARKVLETFLDFCVPEKLSLYQKLEKIDFDAVKKTAILKFVNDNSHFTAQGFEPGLVQESQTSAAYLLELIEATAPTHYAGMVAAIQA